MKHGYTAVLANAARSEDELCASLSRVTAFQTDGALVASDAADFHFPASAAVRDDPGRTVYVARRNPQPGAELLVQRLTRRSGDVTIGASETLPIELVVRATA